jgi:small ligand-binding sensory domain FIST
MTASHSIRPRSVSCLLDGAYNAELVTRMVRSCCEGLGGKPDLVLAFASSDYRHDLPGLIETLRIDGQASRIVGSSAGGLIGVGHELENTSGLSLAFFKLPGSTLEVARSVGDFVGKNTPAGLLVLAHPLRTGHRGPMGEINRACAGVPALGGMITGGPEEEDLFLFTESGKEEVDFLALSFHGGVRIVPLVAQGCRPIGEPMVVTGSRGGVVTSIAGREPFRVLEETFDSLGESLWPAADGNIFAGLAVREEVENFRSGDFLIRHIVGTDLTEGKLALTSPARTGQTIQFQLRHSAVATGTLRGKAAALKAEHGAPFSAVFCSGRGRGRKLFGHAHHDASLIGEIFGNIPVSGFFGAGEFGPVAGLNHRHDHSLCGALFYPA